MQLRQRIRQAIAIAAIVGSLVIGSAVVADGTSTTPLRTAGASTTPLRSAALRPPVADASPQFAVTIMKPSDKASPTVFASASGNADSLV